jgi:hypothetical protein
MLLHRNTSFKRCRPGCGRHFRYRAIHESISRRASSPPRLRGPSSVMASCAIRTPLPRRQDHVEPLVLVRRRLPGWHYCPAQRYPRARREAHLRLQPRHQHHAMIHDAYIGRDHQMLAPLDQQRRRPHLVELALRNRRRFMPCHELDVVD